MAALATLQPDLTSPTPRAKPFGLGVGAIAGACASVQSSSSRSSSSTSCKAPRRVSHDPFCRTGRSFRLRSRSDSLAGGCARCTPSGPATVDAAASSALLLPGRSPPRESSRSASNRGVENVIERDSRARVADGTGARARLVGPQLEIGPGQAEPPTPRRRVRPHLTTAEFAARPSEGERQLGGEERERACFAHPGCFPAPRSLGAQPTLPVPGAPFPPPPPPPLPPPTQT